MKKLGVAYLLCLAIACILANPADAASEQKVHELLQLTGVEKMMVNIMPTIINNMTSAMRQSNPNLPADVPQIVGQVVTEVITPLLPQMTERTVKVYEDNLSDDDVSAAIAFYRTPAGQHLLEKMPQMMQQSMQISQSILSEHIGEVQQRVAAELQKRHPELKNSPQHP